MEIPAGAASFPVVFRPGKSKDESKIEIDYGKRRLTLEGRDEAAVRAILRRVLSAGGVPVTRGQQLRLQLLDDAKDKSIYEFTFRNGTLTAEKAPALKLTVTATDAAGNALRASATPTFKP